MVCQTEWMQYFATLVTEKPCKNALLLSKYLGYHQPRAFIRVEVINGICVGEGIEAWIIWDRITTSWAFSERKMTQVLLDSDTPIFKPEKCQCCQMYFL